MSDRKPWVVEVTREGPDMVYRMKMPSDYHAMELYDRYRACVEANPGQMAVITLGTILVEMKGEKESV